MENISDVYSAACNSSVYVKPYRIHYKQNGVKKVWDVIKSHDSVAILVHNTTRNVFSFVRQFRPAVYASQIRVTLPESSEVSDSNTVNIDVTKYPPQSAFTLELCAGIVDKSVSVDEIARTEILEECGYDVPTSLLEKIVCCRNSVGIGGTWQTLFYAPVTDSMKVSAGGGNPSEGEMLEVIEVAVDRSLELLDDDHTEKPLGLLFALLWFKQYKLNSR